VYELIRRGDLEGIRFGRLVRVPRAALERLAKAQESARDEQ
jgi:excisionase family DNA binding protein